VENFDKIFLFEQGNGGVVQFPKEFLKKAYQLVRMNGGICIADEVFMFLSHLLTMKIPSLAPVSIITDCAGCQPSFVSDIIKEEREKHLIQ
jgi:4-aminobutyrate aminotransferase and related aminotransferases